MQRWEREFSSHPIHKLLAQLEEQLGGEVPVGSSGILPEKNRLRKVLKLIRQVIDQLDPDLAPLDLLQQVHDILVSRNIKYYVEQCGLSGNSDHIRQANDGINQVLPVVYQLSSLKFTRSTRRADIEASTKTFDEFRSQAGSYLESISGQTDEFALEINNLKESTSYIKAEIQKIEGSISDRINEWSSKVTEILNQYSTKFTDANNSYNTEFKNVINEIKSSWKEKSSTINDEMNSELEYKRQYFQSKFDELVLDSEQKHKKILEFYGLVAQDSVTGGYKKDADDEEWQANFWRWSTIVCIFLTAAWILMAIFYLKPNVSDLKLYWADIAKGLSLTTLLVSAAVYTSWQSAIHRANARRARYFFLQVQAFDPFIASLPEDRQVVLKEGMSEKIFKGDPEVEDNVACNNFGVEKLAKTVDLIDRISKIFKK